MKKPQELLRESWQIFSRNWKTYIKILLYSRLFYFPALLITGLLILLFSLILRPDRQSDLFDLPKIITLGLPFLLFLIFVILAETCTIITQLIFFYSPESYTGLTDLYKKSLRYVWPMLLMSGLGGLMIMGGIMLFIIPGIIFLVWFSFSRFFLLFENKKVYESLDASGRLVKARFWEIFMRILTVYLLFYALTYLPLLIRSGTIKLILAIIILLVLNPLVNIYLILLYKNAKELETVQPAFEEKHSRLLYWVIPLFALLLVSGAIGGYMFLKINSPSDLPHGNETRIISENKIIPTKYLSPTPIENNYWDPDCSFSLVFDGQISEDRSEGYKKVFFASIKPPLENITISCRKNIPRPDVPQENIEEYTLDGQKGTLYRNEVSEGGMMRDTVIIQHPDKDFEISISGSGDFFYKNLPNFGFIWG
ncbi:hypothetical protein A2767_06010 [Candidatus Roizmanbacteria bacterium RIFCSPHIGHO2_01_FULL_35_10]|uniref:Glycerophosphoryl diester phosphodiesterase membrane domain-containing protein n=1 Tax=Candidatus Roizmanbacteria bacterium RIFCSPLOWO2_01_FULL_35_13 TaxID=1802055 RepID=A0A1F7IHX0_9BACT|nr:MAG: hypothetical protein A2767_06010 [Candidatus Roizmanbacteria bacterium RIFCSPHIGHO2_01_FULL_35_10]OGK42959.1 MAG: hypothetical protein A3A74_05830 [Candidatus Roizmanbacteria bacterium RIFCSPLOWO2_01_FULL_35_13]